MAETTERVDVEGLIEDSCLCTDGLCFHCDDVITALRTLQSQHTADRARIEALEGALYEAEDCIRDLWYAAGGQGTPSALDTIRRALTDHGDTGGGDHAAE